MTTKTISASGNPELANKLVQQALLETPSQKEEFVETEVIPPSDNLVFLPGGLLLPTGEVIREAEVRELTGRDEEAIIKANNLGKSLGVILQRGTVRIGNQQVTEELLDSLLIGDRDALLLGIFKATFGPTTEITCYCAGCSEPKEANINVSTHIKTKLLADPVEDRVFTVQTKSGMITAKLPVGSTQKELMANSDKNSSELTSILLRETVLSINGMPVYSKDQVQNLGIKDRKIIVEEINNRAPGPQFDDITISCPDCEGDVTVPINFGTLFQFQIDGLRPSARTVGDTNQGIPWMDAKRDTAVILERTKELARTIKDRLRKELTWI